VLPPQVVATARRLNHYIAENAKTARAFLKTLDIGRPIADIQIVELDKHTQKPTVEMIERWLAPLREAHDVGLVSEAGAPAVADPGANVVAAAHRAGFRVRPLVGPSAILLSLMASGLNGQSFRFHGYLPTDAAARVMRIRQLEQTAARDQCTQIFIETPYRNTTLFADLCRTLQPSTFLSIACDITGANEWIRTEPISTWRASTTLLPKLPTMFLFLAPSGR
jgi:16S rRNA (cytidine1402-2'-O)-methyltransferase